jgi:hypothetical protein
MHQANRFDCKFWKIQLFVIDYKFQIQMIRLGDRKKYLLTLAITGLQSF